MRTRNRSSILRFAGLLLALWFLRSEVIVQVKPADLAKEPAGIAGVYQMTVPGAGPTAVQVYFKDGTLGPLRRETRRLQSTPPSKAPA